MTTKRKLQILIDFLMIALLPLLMAYNLIGEVAHEWLGVMMFLLVLVHHILNHNWHKNFLRGRYNIARILGTGIDVWIFLLMILLLVSGIINSKHIFTYWNIQVDVSIARIAHLIASYWCFVFVCVHLGFHWMMIVKTFRKVVHISNNSGVRTVVLRLAAMGIGGYGIYAFMYRRLGDYMFLYNQYAFFDFYEPIILFIIDYMAIMGLFVIVGHYMKWAVTLACSRR